MRAVVVTRHGGPEVLEVAERPTPTPGPRELAVEVGASGVNFIDVYFRTGTYPADPPFVLGTEGAGRVTALGDEVTDSAVGDRVAWKAAPGSYADTALVPAAEAVAVPDGVSDEQAAAVMLQGLTAHYLCSSTYPVAPGEWVLIHAGAGGVGLLLTQLVKLRGGRVITTVSTPEKAELSRGAGADEVLGYDGLVDAVRSLTGGEGVSVVYDGVGSATFDDSLRCLRPRGYLVLFGASSGPVPPVDPQRLNSGGSLFLTRPTLVHYTRTREELTTRCDELFRWMAAGQLDVRIGARYALADAARAHEELQGRRTVGKVLLLPGER